MLLRPGARVRPAKEGDPGQGSEHDGVPILEPQWIRCRDAMARRMASELDHIRVDMMAMFESAIMHQVRVRGLPLLVSAAQYVFRYALMFRFSASISRRPLPRSAVLTTI
jgi:hypothetical protein